MKTSRTVAALALVVGSLGLSTGSSCADDSQTQTVTVTVNAPLGWTADQWNHFVDTYTGEITPAVVAAGPHQVVYHPTNC